MKGIKNDDKKLMELEDLKQKLNFPENKFYESKLLFSKNENQIINNNKKFVNQIIGILNSEFYLFQRIGYGSSGSVYLSYSIYDEKVPKTFYAIKIINTTEPNGNIINSCEVNFLEKMSHKNILKVYGHGLGILQNEYGFKQQVYYIIMDYLNHGSLLSQIDGNKGFGEDFGRLIFAQLLDGLEAIHNSNIVHRDIKLENIMLSGDDYTLKYVDFGFATEKSYGYLNNYLGTPNYAAPELHLKKPYLGVYEDIFSLGVTLFIIVTGYLPFILPSPNDPLYHYIFDIDYISYWKKRNIKVSPSFMELFDNLVAFDPSQRPSISEIKNSKWMKEINWELFPSLKEEFMKREEIYKQNIIYKIEKPMSISLRNIGKINRNNFIYQNSNINNADQILYKIREEKKIEVVKDIRRQLFPMNNIIKGNLNEKNINNEKSEGENDNHKIKKNNLMEGFIKFKLKIKNKHSLMILLKQFLRKQGYTLIQKDYENMKLEMSNGEIDICLHLEKMYQDLKISFSVENGNKQDFIEFKKLMKKFDQKKRK